MSTAIKYAAFSPRVILTLYDMIEDYIEAHTGNGIFLVGCNPDFI